MVLFPKYVKNVSKEKYIKLMFTHFWVSIWVSWPVCSKIFISNLRFLISLVAKLNQNNYRTKQQKLNVEMQCTCSIIFNQISIIS